MGSSCLALERFVGNQLTAHAQRRRAGQDVVESRPLIHSSRSYQGNLRERRFQRPDVMVAAKCRTGKNLDEVRAGFRHLDDLAGCQSAGNDEYAFAASKLHHFVNEPGARQEFRSGSHRALGGSRSRTVPAPTTISGRLSSNSGITPSAPGTVMVISA